MSIKHIGDEKRDSIRTEERAQKSHSSQGKDIAQLEGVESRKPEIDSLRHCALVEKSSIASKPPRSASMLGRRRGGSENMR